ncbi:restriction endonuclease subunit S [Mycobacterium palustre]|uniref:restriction endonuclease subunit S n=1 Tax=Mycobacterium palustre TaxID=153971 RepID=UPI0021F2EA7E|nr:restriction endonuclease subunit S [Mycobacterium palustre]
MSGTYWPTKLLGDLFVVGAGKTMSAASRIGENKVSFLRTSNVFWDEIDLAQVDEMAIPDRELADKLVEPGDLLVCEGGEIGRAAIWEGGPAPMSFQNHLHRLRPQVADVDPRFYVYFLQSAFTQLGIFEGAGNKTTIPNLSSGRLKALEVPHPPLAEQVAIADVLRHVQRARRLNKRVLLTTQELKSAAMEQLFTRGLRGEAQRESEVGPVPESWGVAAIDEHFSVVSGGTPSRSNATYWSGGTIPWVKTTEVNYSVITETEEHITQAGLNGSAAKLLPPGTLLMAMYGQGVTRGKVGILGIEASCNQACAAITPTDDAVVAQYLYHYLTSRYEAIRSLAHGGQQQNLNLDIVRKIDVPVPPTIVEQQEIIDVLHALDRKIDLHRRKRAVLDQLFKSLLHKLMTGEISVDDLDLSALPSIDGSAA